MKAVTPSGQAPDARNSASWRSLSASSVTWSTALKKPVSPDRVDRSRRLMRFLKEAFILLAPPPSSRDAPGCGGPQQRERTARRAWTRLPPRKGSGRRTPPPSGAPPTPSPHRQGSPASEERMSPGGPSVAERYAPSTDARLSYRPPAPVRPLCASTPRLRLLEGPLLLVLFDCASLWAAQRCRAGTAAPAFFSAFLRNSEASMAHSRSGI